MTHALKIKLFRKRHVGCITRDLRKAVCPPIFFCLLQWLRGCALQSLIQYSTSLTGKNSRLDLALAALYHSKNITGRAKNTIDAKMSSTNSGMIQRNQRPNGILAIDKTPIVTPLVGMIKLNKPSPN